MFKAYIPEKIIAEKSGHKSLKALQMYEHTSSLQEQATGVAIINGGQASYSDGESEENADKKPNIDKSGQEKSQKSPPQVPTFTGKLENCTININFS